MFRITTILEDEKNITVPLYGQFTGEYLAEVERALSNARGTVSRAALDLNVTLLDRQGMILRAQRCAGQSQSRIFRPIRQTLISLPIITCFARRSRSALIRRP
jgi:hypothetical protein